VKAFKKLANSSTETSKFQDNVETSFSEIMSKDILNGVLIKNVVLVSGQNNIISHKLERELQGFVVVRQRANSIIWDSQDSNTLKKLTLILNCSANVEIDIWCF
jgi:hypothetical protein